MIVDMENICKDYPSDSGPVHVLQDVTLKIEKGDYIAIMGPSGSGKTTLMNIIGFLDLPTSGTYLLNGVDETQSNEDHLAEVRNQHIGFVFQTFYLLPGLTALENVALPLLYADVPQKERIERAREALKQVGLEDRIDFYPRQLSGGQSQRVAIARAMVGHPQLLLADEPTGALDSTAGSQIMDIFQRLNDEGMTIVMITHEKAVAECANKIYNIFDGRLSLGGELSWEAALEQGAEKKLAAAYTDTGDDAVNDDAMQSAYDEDVFDEASYDEAAYEEGTEIADEYVETEYSEATVDDVFEEPSEEFYDAPSDEGAEYYVDDEEQAEYGAMPEEDNIEYAEDAFDASEEDISEKYSDDRSDMAVEEEKAEYQRIELLDDSDDQYEPTEIFFDDDITDVEEVE